MRVPVSVVNLAWQLRHDREALRKACEDADVVLICEAASGPNGLLDIGRLLPKGWAYRQDLSHGQPRSQVAIAWRMDTMSPRSDAEFTRLCRGTRFGGIGTPDRYLLSVLLKDRESGDARRYASCHAPVRSTLRQPAFYRALSRWLAGHPHAVVGLDANRPRKALAGLGRPVVGREVMAMLLPIELKPVQERYTRTRGSDHPLMRVTLTRRDGAA